MSQNYDLFTKLLRERNQSLTKQRIAVYEALSGQEPLSMRELHVRTSDKLDRASLYRIIQLFETVGISRRIAIGWKYKIELSEAFNEHHHHLHCNSCNAVTAISADELEDFITSVSQTHGFQPVEHTIEVQGLCADCQKISTS